MQHARYFEPEFDEPRIPGRVRPSLFIGPSRTPSSPLLEVMAEVVPPRGIVVFHVMQARVKYLNRMQ